MAITIREVKERKVTLSGETLMAINKYEFWLKKVQQEEKARKETEDYIRIVPQNELADYVEITNQLQEKYSN